LALRGPEVAELEAAMREIGAEFSSSSKTTKDLTPFGWEMGVPSYRSLSED
jgi:hypothetical protein